jgi:UDP-N-acetylmuramoyl-L-alanyl-D-glutamate--2,6-diaminopimelate ligase
VSPSLHQWALEQLAALKVPITHLVTDSRAIQRGDTFVAYPGEKTDGRQFIAEAIAQGANAIIYEKLLMKPLAIPPGSQTALHSHSAKSPAEELLAGHPKDGDISRWLTPAKLPVMSGHPWEAQHFVWKGAWQVPNLAVADLRHKAGWLADAVYGTPSDKLWVVGITGTNGKTSTSHWIAHALNEAGKQCALIGTLGNGFVDALQASVNTTPDAIRVHDLLADYLRDGAKAVAMEVSSHALSQGRVNAVRFDVAMLTNLSRDHLDYHGDMQSYAAAKRKLFEWRQLKYVVLNLDDEFGLELARELSLQEGRRWVPPPGARTSSRPGGSATLPQQDIDAEVIGYGLSDAALQLAERLGLRMVHGNLLEMTGQGSRLAVHSSWGTAELNSVLVGRFNAANLLGALAVLLVSNMGLRDAVQSLSKAQPVAGRMQRLGGAQQPTVIVDYAHTPDALEKVLVALREVSAAAGGRVLCVFGCGGDRDRGKRPMMGLVAEKFSGFCIVTSDNPRGENPREIIAEIVSGMKADNHEIMVDRAAAIHAAIGQARQSDTVLIAGKGHEDYQEIKGVKHPFSDVLVARQALQMHHSGICA